MEMSDIFPAFPSSLTKSLHNYFFSYFRLLILYLHLSHLTSPLCAQVVPNTVSIAREDACEARVITEASSPYKITFASQVRLYLSCPVPLIWWYELPDFLHAFYEDDSHCSDWNFARIKRVDKRIVNDIHYHLHHSLCCPCVGKSYNMCFKWVLTFMMIYHVQSWCDLFGYEASKVIGQTCKMLQGKDTEMDRIAEIMTGVKVTFNKKLFRLCVTRNIIPIGQY